jgi:3-hydroxy-3-methylglutaryl CoA synthase/uncharacterized OB-fold protein
MAEPRVGLVSAAGYVPRYRLSGAVAAAVWGAAAAGERAVANYDEDALTLAVEAALDALADRDPRQVGACLFASTSAPYLEKSNATVLAAAVDLPPALLTADLGGSLRCATSALRLALDAVRAGTVAEALVAAGEVRAVAPGSEWELLVGDAAGAVVVGTGALLATFEGAYSVSHEFVDFWRTDGDRYVQAWPDMTFIRSQGLDPHVREAVDGVLRVTGLKREDIARAVIFAPDARTQAALVRQLGFERAAGEPLMARVGSAGAAACLLELAWVLEHAGPHELVLVVSYGNGAEALLFRTTEAVAAWRPARPLAAQLGAARPLPHYGKWLRFRRHVETELLRAFASAPALVREERQNLRLWAQRCEACGTVAYPRRHLCGQCGSSRLREHKLARRGRVFTFTRDHLVPTPDPPTVMAVVDLEGGGRFYAQVTDCDPGAVAVDMPVELTFRRLHEGEGYPVYFWKFRPVAGGPPGS